MITYQDFLKEPDKPAFVMRLISNHKSSDMVKTALVADLYDARQNKTINEFIQTIYTTGGLAVEDYTASNNRIASNFFNRLNTQRATYSLGNGVTFMTPGVKDRLGQDFDTRLMQSGYYALIHGISFLFFNVDRVYVLKLTEFAPLWDEETGALRAGVRYWRLDPRKPMQAVLYEEDGYTLLRASVGDQLQIVQDKRSYREKIRVSSADGEPEVIGVENYGSLPIIPLWGSRLHQSTLVGFRQSIDSYDLIRSGFANDLTDCAQIYWILGNYGGMTQKDIAVFRDRLKFQHMAVADTDNGEITPYTQDIPHAARQTFLDLIRKGIYEDFGALDVSEFSSGQRTATEIQAMYQPLDEQADDFEYQIIDAVQALLRLIGIDDTPIFKRNRITNQLEQVQMVMMEAGVLDQETLLSKLPNVTPDEIPDIMARKDAETGGRFEMMGEEDDDVRETSAGDLAGL